MSEYLEGVAQPFACCDGPITDLSHNPADLESQVDPNYIGAPSATESTVTDDLVFGVYAEPTVFAPLEEIDAVDSTTYNHVTRVGEWTAQTARSLNLTVEETEIAVRGALLHDQGKVHPDVQTAIHTPRSVAQDPSLYNAIKLHPWHGVQRLAPYGHSPNVLQIVGNHHSLQTERPAYGVFSEIVSMPEIDGRRPDTKRMLEIVAAADVYDALWATPRLGEQGRNYQKFTGEAYGSLKFLEKALGSLQVSDEVRQAVYDMAVNDQEVNNRLN